MANVKPLGPSSPLDSSIPSPKHVTIGMNNPDPSIILEGTAGKGVAKDTGQSQNVVIGHSEVSESDQGPAAAKAPTTSTPNANPSHSAQDAVVPNTENPSTSIPPDLSQYNEFWIAYNDLADKEDKEIVKGHGSDLDTLLIFAGLFSATNTAFIVESYKDLKEDQSDTTNKLLRSLIRTVNQPSSLTEAYLHESDFSATKQSILTNVFFFTSLFCSLLAAFGAVIGKQWLNHYEKEGQLRSPFQRGVERHKKYLGLKQWHFETVIETLPTLLQASLLSFLMGLVQFLWTFNLPIALLALIFTVITSAFWFIFILIGVSNPTCPFQTRLSVILQTRRPFNFLNRDRRGDQVKLDAITGGCVDWLMKRSTAPDTLTVVAKAIAMLSKEARQAINLDRVGAAIGYLLQSKFENNRVHLGVTSETLLSSLVALRDIVRSWDTLKDPVHAQDTENTKFIQTLRHELWDLLLNKENQSPALKEPGLQILEVLCVTDLDDDLSGPTVGVDVEMWENRCGAWLKHCNTEPEKVWVVSESILQRPTSEQAVFKRGRPLALLLESTIQDELVSLQVSNKSLRVLLPILKDLMSQWDRENDLVHLEDASNLLFLRALTDKLLSMVPNTNWKTDKSGITMMKIIATLDIVVDENGLQPMIKALNGLLQADHIGLMDKLHWLACIYRNLIRMKRVPKDYIQSHDEVHKLLLSTMWEPSGGPECQYADVRLGWILSDFEAIYERIPKPKYGQYLQRWWWKQTNSSDCDTLYLNSLRRLLAMDYGFWSTKLESDDRNSTLRRILSYPKSHTDYLRSLVCFFLLCKEVKKKHYPDEPLTYSDFSNKRFQIQGSPSTTDNNTGLFNSMVDVVDSPTEGVRVASGFWQFLVTALRDGRIEEPHMKLERDEILRYLIGRQAVSHLVTNVSVEPSLLPPDLHLLNLLEQYTEDTHAAINDIERASFIRSIPSIDPAIQTLADGMLSRGIPRLRLAYDADDLESILGSVGKTFGGPSPALMDILESAHYAETIATLIGGKTQPYRTAVQPRNVQWWCLRLFLLMWHRRSETNPTPYLSDHCFRQLSKFFRSMKNQVDVAQVKQSIDEVPLVNLSALQFLESACSYFEAVRAQSGLPITAEVSLGYQETCGHFEVSGASQSEEYQGDGGPDKWRQDIAPLVIRMGALLS